MDWQTIYESFKENPRDIRTTPKGNRQPRWFFVYSEKGNVYIDNAREHNYSSKIKQRRKLDKDNFEKMIVLYDKRNHGVPVSEKACAITFNQVYWFGILCDLLKLNY